MPIDSSANKLEEWLTPSGGGLVATGVGGPLTGKPISGVGVIDDPVKNREAAESAAVQSMTWGWYTDTFLSRLHPQASRVIIMTRWSVGDLIGRVLEEEDDWIVVKLPAITELGESLWPEGRPLPFLKERRRNVGEYGWASMYMQEPRPRGGALFEQPRTCQLSDVPTTGRFSTGIDLAYSAKTRADYTAAVTLVESGADIYVAHVERYQLSPVNRDARLHALANRFPGVRMTWHASGTEALEVGDRLLREGLPLNTVKATADKFVRAQPLSAAWNKPASRIIVPRDASWSNEFLDELVSFSGIGDKNDDMVDAAASAYAGLSAGTTTAKANPSKRTHRAPRVNWRAI